MQVFNPKALYVVLTRLYLYRKNINDTLPSRYVRIEKLYLFGEVLHAENVSLRLFL